VIAWKLLQAGSIGLHSGFAWPPPSAGAPGPWVDVAPPLVPSLRGVHAVRTTSLLDWLDDELWEIELAGEIVEADALLVASRGRLRRRVVEWDAAAATAFTAACVVSVRDGASAALDRSGPGVAATARAYVADCVSLAGGGRPDGCADPSAGDLPISPAAIAANVGFVAAAAVGAIAAGLDEEPDAFAQGFARERARQHAWLVHRIGLGHDSGAGEPA
jgi:hypothetical protein